MDHRRWQARTDVFARASATSMIVLPAIGDAVKLNGPAEVIWERANIGGTSAEIAADVATVFDEHPTTLLPFVIETLESLRDAGVVDETTPGGDG